MSILKIALSLLAVLAGIVLLCLGVIYLEKKMPVKNFDERQKQAHGRAYRISYWVGLVYYLIAMLVCVNQVGKEKTIEPYLLFLFGIMLQLTVDATYRMMTNCDLPLYQKRGWSDRLPGMRHPGYCLFLCESEFSAAVLCGIWNHALDLFDIGCLLSLSFGTALYSVFS